MATRADIEIAVKGIRKINQAKRSIGTLSTDINNLNKAASKDIFGKVGKGLHSYRIANIAIVDVLLTVILAYIIHLLSIIYHTILLFNINIKKLYLFILFTNFKSFINHLFKKIISIIIIIYFL